MEYKELIEKRQSVREFRRLEVSNADQNEIKAFFADQKALLPDIDVELRIYTGNAKNRLEGVAGYKGYSFGAPAYLVLLSAKADYAMENAGYITENLILKLTEMGRESCWITVNDSEAVKKALIFESDKDVASIVAFGEGKREVNQNRLDIVTPSNVRFNTRPGHIAPKIALDEMVYENTWGNPADWSEAHMDSTLEDALYAASLAPSFLNRQPYRYVITSENVILAGKKENLTTEDDTMLDLGATMFHFHAVYSDQRASKGWKFGVPDNASEVHVPDEYTIVGYYELPS